MSTGSGTALPGAWRLALTIVGPWAAVGLALKAVRIVSHPSGPDGLEGLSLAGGELLVYGGLWLLLAGMLGLSGRRWKVGVAVGQLICALGLSLGIVSHAYYGATGFTLDWSYFAFVAARSDETGTVAASELRVGLIALYLAALAVAGVWPWLPWARRGGRLAESRWLHAGAALLGGGLVLASLLPHGQRQGTEFFREPAVGFIASVWASDRSEQITARAEVGVRPTGAQALSERPDASRWNVVVVILESTRASATSLYPPFHATTPALARLGSEGSVVERGYTVVPHTSKALTSILCGFEPPPSLSIISAREGGMSGRCLPDLLREEGYSTAYFQAPKRKFEQRPALVSNMGFDAFWAGDAAKQPQMEQVNYFGYEDDVMLEPSSRWLQGELEEPFVAAYLTNATHHPYGVPSDFERRRYVEPRELNDYLNAVAYEDGFLDKLVQQYKDQGLWDRTVFLVVGDHGEAFREHGLRVHDNVMYQEVLQVPLVFRIPNRPAERLPGPFNQLSIVPTLLDAVGFDVASGGYAAPSMLQEPGNAEVFATCFRTEHCGAVVWGDYKLIHHFGERPAELYNLADDPQEREDLAAQRPDDVARWGQALVDWRAAIRNTHRSATSGYLSRYVRDEPQEVDVAMDVTFGELLRLRGYRRKHHKVRFNKRSRTQYFFEALAPIPAGYRLRVRGEYAGQVRYFDHVPVRGTYPLVEWEPGKFVEDRDSFKLRRPWKGGKMALCVQLLDAARHPVLTDADEPCAPVGEIEVVSKKRKRRK